MIALWLSIPINRWSVATTISVIVWVWLEIYLHKNRYGGPYDFMPMVVMIGVTVGLLALWAGLLIGAYL